MRYRRFGRSDLVVWDDNLGVTNRCEMPLKSSTGG